MNFNIRRRSEKGNILFLILLAVVLFAALSYAVTQSLRGGGQGASNETNLVSSASLTSYPVGVRAAILRMTVGGTDVTTLRFDPPSVFAIGITTSALQALNVFHPSGGGAVFSLIPSNALVTPSTTASWVFNSLNEINGIGTSSASTGASAPGNDLIAFADGLTSGLCQKINTELGVSTIPVLTAAQTTTITAQQNVFLNDGTTANTTNLGLIASSTANDNLKDNATASSGVMANKPFLCVQNGASGSYLYYHVLVER